MLCAKACRPRSKPVARMISWRMIITLLMALSLISMAYMYFISSCDRASFDFLGLPISKKGAYSSGNTRQVKNKVNEDFTESDVMCKNIPESLEEISVVIALWQDGRSPLACRKLGRMFSSVYQVREKHTTLKISDSFMGKVARWLDHRPGLIKQTENQRLVFVDNFYSQESVVFNSVRGKRPGLSAGNSKEFINQLLNQSSKDCDFCNYKNFTGQDNFGILESEHSVIVSNAFKIEKFHGLSLLRKHSPIDFNLTEFIDQINLIGKWFKVAQALAPDHLYRFMYWDVFSKASASQLHPHIHLALGSEMYYMKWKMLHLASEAFTRENQGHSYWAQIINIHLSLALGTRFGDAVALAYLTPQKDYEVLVISFKPTVTFFQLAFCVIRTFFDDLGLYAVSMGFVFPKLHTPQAKLASELPAIFRILSRGALDSQRSDISSFDLFGTPNVNKDPFSLAPLLKQGITSRCTVALKPSLWHWDD